MMVNENIFEKRTAWVLFILRLSVFLVLFMWTIDKFINPEHAAAVFKTFYMIDNLNTLSAYIIGTLQAIIIFAFLIGYKKRWSTGFVLLMHLISTLTPMARYFDPWSGSNLLFFAAWPMLAAIIVLYVLRDADSLLSIESKSS